VRLERLPDESLIVVRGGALEAEAIRADAERTFRRFGERGISVFAATTADELAALGQTLLRRYEVLTVTTAGSIRRAGLELRATFRRPHYTVMLPDSIADTDRLLRCENEQRMNPYFRREEAD